MICSTYTLDNMKYNNFHYSTFSTLSYQTNVALLFLCSCDNLANLWCDIIDFHVKVPEIEVVFPSHFHHTEIYLFIILNVTFKALY